MQQRESAKKAAASAAAAAAAHVAGRGSYSEQAVTNPLGAPVDSQQVRKIAVTRTASWLDRANAILTGKQQASSIANQDHADAVRSLPQQEIEKQMKEVQRLIHEGPVIQQSTVALPAMLNQDSARSSGNQPDSPSRVRPPVDKRPRRLSGDSGAADAEALVGFLKSVRANAEASAVTGSD
jgi:hypothetical protein